MKTIEKIKTLIKNKTNNIFIDNDKIINYFSYVGSDFDSTENLIEFFDNKKNFNKDEFIIGVGFDNDKELFIITETRPFFLKFPKINELENYIYNIKDINQDYLSDIIEKIKIIDNLQKIKN